MEKMINVRVVHFAIRIALALASLMLCGDSPLGGEEVVSVQDGAEYSVGSGDAARRAHRTSGVSSSTSASNPLSTPELAGPSELKEVEEFSDSLINRQLAAYNIPGALVVVVADGQVLLAKGYGYADLETHTPFTGDQTLFRIGSTGKLLTWTAVMQLAERGQLDLDKDVNYYLKGFQIPATYPEPITMKHLMSHSAGFEELNLGTIASNPQQLIPIREYVRRFMPARVRPPGVTTAYSNYGATLAGYIVQTISGVPFEQYIEDNLLRPLGMTRTSFRQPLPPGMAELLATSYFHTDVFEPQPTVFVNIAPAGSLSTTGTDLSRFMIAHLEDGCYNGACVLRASTTQEMHRRLFSNDPRLSGMAYGFMDRQINGQRILEHGGGLPAYFGVMDLLPESHVGFYVGYNSDGAAKAIPEFQQVFMDHYYPAPKASTSPLATDPAHSRLFSGRYQTTRRNHTSLERILDLIGTRQAWVTANPDGTIHLQLVGVMRQFEGDCVEIQPALFISTDGKQKLSFTNDSRGRVTRLILDSNPEIAYERLDWYQDPSLILKILFTSLVVLASTFLATGMHYVSWRRSHPSVRRSALDPARGIALALSGVDMVIVIGTVWLMRRGGFVFERPTHAAALSGLAWLAVLLTIGVLVFAVRAWLRSEWRPVGRLHYTLVAVASLLFVWCLHYWNLLR